MEKQAKRRVVITGMGVVSSIGTDKEAFLKNIRNGKSGIRRIQSFDPSPYHSQIAGEVKNFDPAQYMPKNKIPRGRSVQFAVAASKMALTDSELSADNMDKEKTGVIIGTSSSGIGYFETEHNRFLSKGRVSPYATTGVFAGSASSEVSIHLGITGLSFTLSNGCTAATDAIGCASHFIRKNMADVILAGGAEAPITPVLHSGFCSLRAVSKRNHDPEGASRPFDATRDGMVLAEGAGVLVLEELNCALNRNAHIYGEVLGYGATCDGFHLTHPKDDGINPVRAMRMALDDAKITPEKIDCISAHGTSTRLNDKIETSAIKRVFGDHAFHIPISAVKSMTGHGIGASGGIEMIAALLGIQEGFIPPTINLHNPDPECDLDYVPNQVRLQKVNVILKNSLGFGGKNASLVVKRM